MNLEFEDKIDIQNYIKELYKIRSELVHGSICINKQNRYDFYLKYIKLTKVLRIVFQKLILDKELVYMTSIKRSKILIEREI